jgi:adenylate cyclase
LKELPFPELPSIAMLPFQNLTDSDRDPYYGEGLRYELQAAFIKISELLLIAPACVSPYRNTPDAAERAARELGVDYILEGSFRKKGDKIETTFQLTNTGLHRIIWAKQFRATRDRTSQMQNEVVLGVLESLHIDVHAGEEARIFQHTISKPEAREFFYRGTNLGYSMTKEGNTAARAAFRNVVRLQPDSPVGPTYLSFTYWLEVFKGWTSAPDRQLAKGVTWAKRALDLSDGNGLAYIVLSHDHLTRDRHSDALATSFRSVEFRPNCPTANGFLGYVLLHSGRPSEAIEWIRRAMKRSPKYPPWFVNVLAAAYRDAGDYETSMKIAQKSLVINPADIEARAILCTDFVLAGERQQAIRLGKDIGEIQPAFSCRDYINNKHYRNPDTASQIEASLRTAQLPR